MNKVISEEELKEHLKSLLYRVKVDDMQAISQKILEFLMYCSDNYDKLSTKAQKRVDNAFDSLGEYLGEVIKSLPEEKQKRKCQRIYALVSGKHWYVKTLVDILESPPRLKASIFKETRQTFLHRLQDVLDLLFDVSKHKHRGTARFAQISLLYFCVDELLAGFHLAQHAYTNQAYAHIRTIYECLDKITLFAQQPNWADVWCSEDEKKILNELGPAAVREKLGQKRFDPVYSFFSKLGPHSTFQAIRARTGVSKETLPRGKTQVGIWVGGCPQEYHVIMTNFFLIYVLLHVVIETIAIFDDYLDREEAIQVLQDAMNEFKKFTLTHVVQWAKGRGLDTSEIEEFLNNEEVWHPRNMIRRVVERTPNID